MLSRRSFRTGLQALRTHLCAWNCALSSLTKVTSVNLVLVIRSPMLETRWILKVFHLRCNVPCIMIMGDAEECPGKTGIQRTLSWVYEIINSPNYSFHSQGNCWIVSGSLHQLVNISIMVRVFIFIHAAGVRDEILSVGLL